MIDGSLQIRVMVDSYRLGWPRNTDRQDNLLKHSSRHKRENRIPNDFQCYRWKTWILLFLICIISQAHAVIGNKTRIEGTIRDYHDGSALPYVNVFLQNTQIGAATNQDGHFVIEKVPPGVYTVVIQMIGYRTLVIPRVPVYTAKIRVIHARLKRQILELGSIGVSADRMTQLVEEEHSLAGHQIISPRQIVSQVGALEDASRAMTALPGVIARNDMNTQLYIRGGSPDQNLVLFDGVEIVNPSRLFVVMGGGVSIVNPDIIQSIDLAPGGFDVEDGNKLSALMRISTRDGRRDRVAVQTSAALVTARAVAEGPLSGGRGSWLIAGRRSFYDLVANQFFAQNYVFPYFLDLHFKLAYQFSADNRLRLFYSYLTEGAQLFDFETEKLDLLNKGIGGIYGVQYSTILSSRLAMNFLGGLYRDKNSVQIYDTDNYKFRADLHYEIRRFHVRGDVQFYPTPWLLMKSGFQLGINRNAITWDLNWRNYIELPDHITFAASFNQPSAYWQARIRWQKSLEINTGLRYDYSTLYNESTWSPRIKAILAISPRTTLWLGTGAYSQFPDILTIIARGEPLNIAANPSALQAEQALHHILGLNWRPSKRHLLKIEFYEKSLSHLLAASETNPFLPKNTGQGSAFGLELTFQKERSELGRIGYWANYSYSVSKYRVRDDQKWIYFDFDQRHQIAAGWDLRLARSFNLSGSWRYGSGFPYTPFMALQRNVDEADGYMHGWQLHKHPKNSARYPFYSRFDLRFSHQLDRPTFQLQTYIDVMNLFNHQNVYQYQWDFYPNASGMGGVGKRSVVYMMPFVPSFGVQLSW